MIPLYLLAIVSANLLAAKFGPGITVVTAFLFIGFDLVARDRLHRRWEERGALWPRMAALVIAGSLISYLVNAAAGPIALASCVAFAAGTATDAVVFALLRGRSERLRVNGSNLPAALVDSILFPTLAFGSFLPGIVAGQLVAKVVGGLVWSLLLVPGKRADAPPAH